MEYKQKSLAFYQWIAPYYDRIQGVDENNIVESQALENERIVKLLGYFRFDTSKTFVDLGCGTGLLCCYLGFLGYRVFGVDSSSAMLDVARSRKDRYGLTRVSFREEDAAVIRFGDEQKRIGFVYSRGMITHICEEAALKQVFDNLFEYLPPSTIVVFETYTQVGISILMDQIKHDFPGFLYEQWGTYDQASHRGVIDYRIKKNGSSDEVLEIQSPIRFWELTFLQDLLVRSGFRKVECFDSMVDIASQGHGMNVSLKPVSPFSDMVLLKAERL